VEGRIVGNRLLRERVGGCGPAGDGGFTIVEALLSMAIASTVLLAVLGMFNTAFITFGNSKMLTMATNLAYGKVADFKTMTVAAIVAQTPKIQNYPPLKAVPDYICTWTVSNVDVDNDGIDDMVGDVIKIDLRVDWVHAGRPHSVSMATLSTGKPQ
jgi:hypothetical protein